MVKGGNIEIGPVIATHLRLTEAWGWPPSLEVDTE